jgi:hypothetical protein
MATFVKVRGLARRGFRVNNRQVTSGTVRVFDLDDGLTRRDISHHMSIGQLAIVDGTDAAVARTGAETTAGTTTTVSVAAGTVFQDSGVPGRAANSAAITASPNMAGITVDPTNPRYALLSVPKTGGAPVLTLGAAAATPAVPALPANSVPLSLVLIPAAAASSAAYTITDIAPRL